jgi:hypothetical protein
VEIRNSGATEVYKTKSFRCQNSETRLYSQAGLGNTHVRVSVLVDRHTIIAHPNAIVYYFHDKVSAESNRDARHEGNHFRVAFLVDRRRSSLLGDDPRNSLSASI